jgi:hypothetical protein
MNLTTTTRFKVYAGMTGTSQDALIAALIAQVSDQLVRYLRRDLAVTTYKSWIDGSGNPLQRLEQWPILAIYQVSVTSIIAGYIKNTAATTKRASVSFDGTNLSLMSVSNTGTETLTDKPVSTSKILSTLKTAIEAVTGWEVTLNSADYDGEPSNMLRPIYAQDALDPNMANLLLPDHPEAVKLISEDTIELATKLEPDMFARRSDARGSGFGGGSIVPGFDATPGIGGGFPAGTANIFIWYKAGYTLPSDTSGETPASDGTLPQGLALIVHEILQDVLSSTKLNSNLQSESIGGYSYSLRSAANGAVASAIENRKKDLNLYRRVSI